MSHTLTQQVLPCSHEHKPIIHHSHAHGKHEHHTHEIDVHRPQQRRALLICVVLTAVMMVVEFVAGYLTGSLMLVSDAIHMLSHATALGVSLLAVVLAQKKTNDHLPFGLYRVEILAALFNGIGLAGFSIWIVYEGILRILNPVDILGPELTAVALIGLAVNLTTAVILQKAGLEDLNTKSAFLHMLADTFSSVAIVIGGVIISFTNWVIVDPILSMAVAVLVARWSWSLLRDSVLILLERKPDNVSISKIQTELKAEFPTIKDIHDLHIWEITSQFVCLTAHIVLDDMKLSETQRIRSSIIEHLEHHFGIAHAVIQVEC
ncbi:MAG: cation diffusion facilitator family transporter [Bacteroidota bacterium]